MGIKLNDKQGVETMKTFKVAATIPADETGKGFKTTSGIAAANEAEAAGKMANMWPEATEIFVVGLIEVLPTERGTWG
jgi:hypothetical protein